MSFSPNVFLIGAQKAGTTFLATLLGQHPDVCVSEPKEPHYFTQHWKKGDAWYRGRFSAPGARFLVDASTSYSAAPLSESESSRMAGVPGRIAEASPDAMFVYVMRDPVTRTYSSYWHSVRAGEEQRPLGEVIKNGSYLLRMGCYHHQLMQYFRYFDRKRFKLIFFEEFINNPEETANDCFAWLGLEPLTDFYVSAGKHQSYAYGPLVGWLDRRLGGAGSVTRLLKRAHPLVPAQLRHSMRRLLTKPVPSISEDDKEWLARYFVKPNSELESELGLTLPNWTRPRTTGG